MATRTQPSRRAATVAKQRTLENLKDLDNAYIDDEKEDETYTDAFQAASDGDGNESDNGYESDEDASGDEEREYQRKSQQEIDAEKCVALGLDIPYSCFVSVRKSIHWVHRIMGDLFSTEAVLKAAFDNLVWDRQISNDEASAIVDFAITLAGNIEIPHQEISNTFLPLSECNGGIFTKVSQHPNVLFAISLMAHMVYILPSFNDNGSAQKQGFTQLLQNSGLAGDVVDMMANMYATDTPLDSAKSEGKQLACKLNQLDCTTRMRVLFANLASFENIKRVARPASLYSGKVPYNYTFFDNRRPRGMKMTAINAGSVMVSVTLLHRTAEDDIFTKKLSDFYGPAYSPLLAKYRSAPDFLHFVRTHRAQVLVPCPTPTKVANAFQSMINSTEKDKAVAPELKRYLDFALSRNSLDSSVNEHFNGFCNAKVAACCVYYNDRLLRIGKVTKRSRSPKSYGPLALGFDDSSKLSNWLYMGGAAMLSMNEFEQIMCPPYEAYNTGTADFFLVLTDKDLQYRVDPAEARSQHAVIVADATETEVCKRRRIDIQTSKKRKVTEKESKEIALEGNHTWNTTYDRVCCEDLQVSYPKSAYPDWHRFHADDEPSLKSRNAVKARKEVKRRAENTRVAKKNHTDVVDAEPGNAAANAAAASWNAAANTAAASSNDE